MVNRRYLRIKVMQALYGFFQSEKSDLPKTEKDMMQSIDKMYDLYIYVLAFLADLHHIASLVIEDGRNKKLPSKEDLDPNTKFLENIILKQLSENTQLNKEINTRKISWQNDIDLERKLFHELKTQEFYKAYMLSDSRSIAEDRQFLLELVQEFLAEHELFNHWIEEKNIHWVDDSFIAITSVLKTIEHADKTGKITLSPLYKEPEEDKEFARNLLVKSIVHNEEFEELISQKTKNWEIERIALLDVMLMKMALTELTCFNNIPVKVTLNEYIEISKDYSTPKSKVFINGILDKLLLDLKESKRIGKTGRGLVE